KNQEEDRLKGYESGADDYISKPFSMPELLKKIEVFLRRTKKLYAEKNTEIPLGKIVFQPAALKIITPSETIGITQKEAEILSFFCRHQSKVLKRNEVLLNVWGK